MQLLDDSVKGLISARQFLIADLHIRDPRIGKTVWQKFKNAAYYEETLVERWNNTVSPNDTVVLLGDIVCKPSGYEVLNRLNGNKILIAGNRDMIDEHAIESYYGVYSYLGLSAQKIILSHVPVHPFELNDRRWDFNVHGHLHKDTIPDDYRYYGVSVERVDWTPIDINEVTETLYNLKKYYG